MAGSWLGKPKREQARHSMHLTYRFAPEIDPERKLNVKVEINTREHARAFGLVTMPYAVRSDWHQAEADIVTFVPEELFGTKLRAFCNDARTATSSTCTMVWKRCPSITRA